MPIRISDIMVVNITEEILFMRAYGRKEFIP